MDSIGSPFLAFVATRDTDLPDTDLVLVAAEDLGLEMALEPATEPGRQIYLVEGEERVQVVAMRAPIPDLATRPRGPTSLPPAVLTTARSHLVLSSVDLLAYQEQAGLRAARTLMSVATAAVMAGCDPIAAVVGTSQVFHRADVFRSLAEIAARDATAPAPFLVDITSEAERRGRISLLTHGMADYGGVEEIAMTCGADDTDALAWFYSLVEYFIDHPSTAIPTGDTIGRDGEEELLVRREPNPSGRGLPVFRLDLP